MNEKNLRKHHANISNNKNVIIDLMSVIVIVTLAVAVQKQSRSRYKQQQTERTNQKRPQERPNC